MTKKIRKPLSTILSLIMILSVFTIIPVTSASAAVGDYLSEDNYLTFTAEEANSSVTLKVASGSNLKYNKNNTGWEDYTKGSQIDLENAGDYVRFSGNGTKTDYINHFSITGKVACSGNVMSLRLDDDGKIQGLTDYCFNSMFEACTGLTSAPELPETELADYCYYRMFYGCINLTKAPALPATTLAQNCYNNMFSGCESLTELPALPATTLAERCYRYMFYGCSKICISDEAGTFDDITYSAEYRIPTTGEGTWAYDALYGMFNGTGGKFTGTPDINTTYYVPAPAPTTYTITDASVNGTVTASVNGTNVTEAEENADVTLTVAPTEGYQFVSISAGDVSLNTVTEGSQYSFTMPNKPVTVTAVFEEIPAPAHTHDGITFDAWEHTDSLPTEAGNYYLTADVAISATWTVPAGETKLCLNGHTLSYTGSNGSVIQLNNADQKLTVYDCGTTGAITGGNTTGNGGGVQITAGTFELKNGSIEGNIADNGGGVSLQNSGNFIMSGGTIRYNCGYGNTGGVLVLNNNFTMTGGAIQYNVGKVFGGIGIASSQPNMSGTPVVEGNVFFSDTTRTNTKITKTDSGYTLASGGTPSDIRHATANGLKINIVGALQSGANVGIFNNNQTAAFTNGYKTYNPNDDPKDYFFSNDSNRFIMRDTAKEAQLGGYFTVTWKGADGTVLETDENVVTGTTPEFNGTIPEKPENKGGILSSCR